MAYTLSDLRSYVRDLTGIYSTDLVSDSLLNRWINEAYFELARLQKWSWANNLQPLSEPTNAIPVFSAEFHQILAYRTAIKVLGFESDDSNRTELYTNEYGVLLAAMETALLRTGTATSATTRLDIRNLTKSLLGDYTRALPDTLLDSWINEEYQLLASEKPWRWLNAVHQEDLSAGPAVFSLPNGSRRVLEIYLVEKGSATDTVTDAVSYYEVVEVAPHLLDAELNAAKYRYSVTTTGEISILPALPRAMSARVRYTQQPAALDSDTAEPLFDNRFRPLLAYRAALRAAAYVAASDTIISLCRYGADTLLESMISEYQLSHSLEPLQLGVSALETRKYMPWFRTD